MSGEKLCIALDFPTSEEVLAMARRLAGRVGWFKVGLEAFVAEGPSLVAQVAATGAKVFLDVIMKPGEANPDSSVSGRASAPSDL